MLQNMALIARPVLPKYTFYQEWDSFFRHGITPNADVKFLE